MFTCMPDKDSRTPFKVFKGIFCSLHHHIFSMACWQMWGTYFLQLFITLHFNQLFYFLDLLNLKFWICPSLFLQNKKRQPFLRNSTIREKFFHEYETHLTIYIYIYTEKEEDDEEEEEGLLWFKMHMCLSYNLQK